MLNCKGHTFRRYNETEKSTGVNSTLVCVGYEGGSGVLTLECEDLLYHDCDLIGHSLSCED